jgi:hypothetical protein
MHCDRARTIMISAMDEPITDAQRRELAAHVRGCERCEREQRQLERLTAALDRLGDEVAVPPGLEGEVLRRIREPAEAGPSLIERLRAWMSPPALAAACAAGLILVLTLAERATPPVVAPRPVARAPVEPGMAPTVTARATPAARGGAGTDDGEAVVMASASDRWTSPDGPPPAELEGALPLLLDLPILRNMEKLEHYDNIATTTLADEEEKSG